MGLNILVLNCKGNMDFISFKFGQPKLFVRSSDQDGRVDKRSPPIITWKLQLNYRITTLEDELNRTPRTKDIKKPHWNWMLNINCNWKTKKLKTNNKRFLLKTKNFGVFWKVCVFHKTVTVSSYLNQWNFDCLLSIRHCAKCYKDFKSE